MPKHYGKKRKKKESDEEKSFLEGLFGTREERDISGALTRGSTLAELDEEIAGDSVQTEEEKRKRKERLRKARKAKENKK